MIYYIQVFYILISMIGKKSGKGCAKKFILVQTKSEFDKLPCTSQSTILQRKQKDQYNIIIPTFTQIQCPLLHRQKPIPKPYIKIIHDINMMNKQNYQLDSTDLCFVQHLKPTINKITFMEIIKSLEKMGSKYDTQFNYKAVINKKLTNKTLCYNQQTKNDLSILQTNKSQLIRKIYNYWRNKRKNIRSPLLRVFWTKTEVGPFKIREQINNNICLRNRAVKVENQIVCQTLKQDLLQLKEILNMMKDRQTAQCKLIQKQKISFQKACRKVLVKVQTQIRKAKEDSEQSSNQTIAIRKISPKYFTKNSKDNKYSKKRLIQFHTNTCKKTKTRI